MEPPDKSCKTVLDRPTLILNRSWMPVHVTIVRRAICLLYRDAARVVSEDFQLHDLWAWIQLEAENGIGNGNLIRCPCRSFPAPEVIQLRLFDKVPTYSAPFTRRNLFQRDAHTCQYCGQRYPTERLSVDHVLPRSRGGHTGWDNCVLACVRCNSAKGDRDLKTSGLRLRRPPRPPRWTPYLNLRPSEWLESWSPFTTGYEPRSATGS